ncbi:MAG: methyltransferase domain-containing protein [Candidatus Handelsmanbacteria bacterium]|nr:methyltransferase domain-containing protein [Candidatus Handelsmanbacteria bacterium]
MTAQRAAAPLPQEVGPRMEHQQQWWEDRAGKYYETMDITGCVKEYITGRRADLVRNWLTEGDRWLDLGVGTGTIFAAALARTTTRAVGMDYARPMVRIARGKPRPYEAGFLQGNGISLPFKDGSFDLAFSVDVLHHIAFEGLDRLRQTLDEVRRVLRSGGRIVIYEANPLNLYWYYYMRKIGEDNARLMRRPFLKRTLEERGFEVVASRYMGFVPQFLSAKGLAFFRPVERLVEGTPGLSAACSNYFLVGVKTG